MPINDTSKKLLSHNGLTSQALSSKDIFHGYNDYGLGFQRSSFNTAASVTTKSYNSTTGYGLINAAAAVSRASGKNTFADVKNSGGNNWGADLVKAPEAWAKGYTGKGVVVAVVDTGVDYNHEDLKNNIWTNTKEIAGNGIDDDGNGYVDDIKGWNFANNNNNTLDNNGHGTHVSGTIAGQRNDYGVTGIAYDAKIMPVKVLNDSGSGSYSAIANGIYYAVNNGANVINLSLGGSFGNRTLQNALEYASSKGVTVVMAAGNDGSSQPDYPARYAKNTGIAVGAVDQNNNLANFSNRSGTNQLAYVTAPGVNIYSSVPNNQYATYSGTSMASPHVAGVVALMLSANRNLTPAQVRQIITETAEANTSATNSNVKTSFNLSSVVQQAMSDDKLLHIYAPIPDNQTSARTLSFNTASSEPQINEPSQLPSHSNSTNISTKSYRYYDSSLSIKSDNSPNEEKPNTGNNGNNMDFGKFLEQISGLQKQLEEYRRYLGLSKETR
ncbi:S8 family serine peptidase [Nostoc sp. FACHB-152]|uniref:S8 family peptidase n=1 Tax=unclassified Nostoc TaxID=2593658 RepID=UPI0016869636|nr:MULTISPECIES: S8 family peptidase [unclassified Nostoc]MBD2449347.1 S8 family serine peptidase [Nostoc sp. FACHB-152]MBD2470485.1 S8 family serine peptidase [Nostoc sp. FACHB-145]